MNSYVTSFWKGGLGNQIYFVYAIFTYSFLFNKIPVFFNYKDSFGNRPTYWDSIFKYLKLKNIDTINDYNWVSLNDEEFYDISNTNVQLNGYFQDVKLFQKYKEDIKNILKIEEQQNEIKNKYHYYFNNLNINNKKIVGIHFRIGDYRKGCNQNLKRFGTGHPGMPILPEIYYKKCLEHIDENSFLFVFCEEENDDEVKEILSRINTKNLNYIFIRSGYETDDLLIMSLCDKIIIANSSYSWWAAYWSREHTDIFIPCKWFDKYTSNDKIISGWNVINY
jgi:hypothetical protein